MKKHELHIEKIKTKLEEVEKCLNFYNQDIQKNYNDIHNLNIERKVLNEVLEILNK
jgi:chromosome segregation ATPase